MPIRKIRITLALVALLAGALALASTPWSHGSAPSVKHFAKFDPHGNVKMSKAERRRILAATEAANNSSSHEELVAQGREIFRSNTLSRTAESCESCHAEGAAVASIGTLAHGGVAPDFKGLRDPLPLYDVTQTPPYTWGGTQPSLTTQTTNVVKKFYKPVSDATTGQFVAALMAYMGTIKPPVSPIDLGTMSDAAKRGENVFNGKGKCSHCHTGSLFTDLQVHDTGVPKPNGETDPGKGGNAFDTPTLRDIRNTAPYMHNGSLPTLQSVVDFYNNQAIGDAQLGGNLSPQEESDLVEFLKAL